MTTPKLRADEIIMVAQPRAMCVTTTRKVSPRRYHLVAGAWTIWRSSGNGPRELVRMAVHTRCRDWITLPQLVDEAPFNELCDLCDVHDRRDRQALQTTGQVDF
jgi:hypothetical protein